MLDERTPTKSARGKHPESGRILPNARCEPCSEAASGEHSASLYFHFATDSTAGPPVSRYRPHRLLRAIRLGILLYGTGRRRRGYDTALYSQITLKSEPRKTQQKSVADEGEFQFTPSNCNACFLFWLIYLSFRYKITIKRRNLWHTTLDKVTVNTDGSVVFSFKNGSEVEV